PLPPPTTPPINEVPNQVRENAIARAKIVFGSRLTGPERYRELEAKSTLIAGVLVPPRPTEPDNCCMSGCVNCVWDQYRDEVEEWAAKSTEARRREAEMRVRTSGSAPSMDDDGGGSETNWGESGGEVGEGGDLFGGIPVGIREFMKTEKRLKEMHQREGT
ncbi:hypothetical protein EJ06DRAFT_462349, partial [Trichodelitschia bisporula]